MVVEPEASGQDLARIVSEVYDGEPLLAHLAATLPNTAAVQPMAYGPWTVGSSFELCTWCRFCF